jgi:SNF2 family DNA or RNA helicase
VAQKDRQKRIDAFQNRQNPRVMVISSAGGEGIDLFRADRLIFIEREWQPGTEEQAEARCHRMGQKNAVEAIYLIASDTVDCKMDMLIESKREVIGNLIKMDSIETHSNNSVDEFIKLIKEDK